MPFGALDAFGSDAAPRAAAATAADALGSSPSLASEAVPGNSTKNSRFQRDYARPFFKGIIHDISLQFPFLKRIGTPKKADYLICSRGLKQIKHVPLVLGIFLKKGLNK